MIDGNAAAQTMLGFGTWRPGYCLEAVWQAYKRNGARTDRNAATAYIGWQISDDKHPGDRNPPPGVPVWWGPRRGSAAGDVVISLGGGRVVATDWPRNGVIGITTIDARERQIGRPYLGWTGDILGVPIDHAQRASTPAGSPQPPMEDEMTHSVIVNGNIYGIGQEFISHYGDVPQATITRQVTSASDELHKLSLTDFVHLLDGLGIPRSVLDANGRVLNPQSGKYESNGVWSRRREAVALLERLTASE